MQDHSIETRSLFGDTFQKYCPRCKTSKPISEFHKGRGLHGRQGYCKPCTAEHYRENAKQRNNYHAKRIKRVYGLSWEEYQGLCEKQGHRCAICKNDLGAYPAPRGAKFKHFQIDHCHKTGKVRGLLCKLCNVGLGSFQDSPSLLRAAAEYLERSC